MRIAFFESFYGGSHKSFLDGLIKYSQHEIIPFTLPDRFWKWRHRASALYFADLYSEDVHDFDLIIASDMMNLAEFKAITKFQGPTIMFFHENQLAYPRPANQSLDFHFAVCNLASALTADLNLFNSNFQYNAFQEEIFRFINQIPEFVPLQTPTEIMNKSRVIYMGCDFERFLVKNQIQNDEPIILWNHRWEFDKQPEVFFKTLYALADEGIPFKLYLLGENHQIHPKAFLEAKDRLSDRILHFGFIETEDDYYTCLQKSDIVVSTAIQENFGFSVAEAIFAKTLPLLPNRLSYPELIDKTFHHHFLYENDDDLLEKMRDMLVNLKKYDSFREELSKVIAKFHWKARIGDFDTAFENVLTRQIS